MQWTDEQHPMFHRLLQAPLLANHVFEQISDAGHIELMMDPPSQCCSLAVQQKWGSKLLLCSSSVTLSPLDAPTPLPVPVAVKCVRLRTHPLMPTRSSDPIACSSCRKMCPSSNSPPDANSERWRNTFPDAARKPMSNKAKKTGRIAMAAPVDRKI